MMNFIENILRIKDNIYFVQEKNFDKLEVENEYVSSFIYLVFCTLLSVPIQLAVSLVMGNFSSTLSLLPLIVPVSIILAYLIFAILYIFIKLCGGEGTLLRSFQVFIYGTTPSVIFGGVPVVGLLALAVSIVNVVLGSSKIHKISYYRSVMAIVLIPVILVIILYALHVL